VSVERAILYVDGFNLYFGLKTASFKRYYWLDIYKLGSNLLKANQKLVAAHYFTSHIKSNGENNEDMKRQNTYIEALQEVGVKCQFGHYLQKTKRCYSCDNTWPHYEEKMTDVNIAIQLLTDAFDDVFDVALVLSGDSDLSTPIRKVRERFPHKRIVVVFPPKRFSKELNDCADATLALGRDKLHNSQLPESLTKSCGFVLHRPTTWN